MTEFKSSNPDKKNKLTNLIFSAEVLIIFGIWLLLALTPALSIHFFGMQLGFLDATTLATAGTIGDACGLVTSFFSCLGLLYVIRSLRIQQKAILDGEVAMLENTKLQEKQAKLLNDTARLNATHQIYQHYSTNYKSSDTTGVGQAIADGHKRWAVRNTFDSIDDVLRDFRYEQVQSDFQRLKNHFKNPSQKTAEIIEVASLTSSLLLEEELNSKERKLLWPLYELLRRPTGQNHVTQDGFFEYAQFCENYLLCYNAL